MNSRKSSEHPTRNKNLSPRKPQSSNPYNFPDLWKHKPHPVHSKKFQHPPMPSLRIDVIFPNVRNFGRILHKDKAVHCFVKSQPNSFWWKFQDVELSFI